MSAENPTQILATGEATGLTPSPGNNGKPITVISTAGIPIRARATRIRKNFTVHLHAPGLRFGAGLCISYNK